MWRKLSIEKRLIFITIIALFGLCLFITGLFFVITHYYYSYEAFQASVQLDLTTATENEMAAYFETARQQLWLQSLLILTLFFIVFGSLLYLLIKRLYRPMRKLKEEIEALDIEALPETIELDYQHSDIQNLQTAFNQMLFKVHRTLENQKNFAAAAAHELKTPLSSILANLDVYAMDETPSQTECHEVLKITKNNTERMRDLVKALLELTQLNIAQPKIFHFNDLTILTDEFNAMAIDKNINVTIQGDTKITGSPVLMERALQNLVHNAIRYNQKAGYVNVTATDHEIRISDNGMGMKKDDLDRIFEPFYCVDASRSKDLGGHGLGLSIVKQIIDLHHFKIAVESTIEKGTTFTITF